MDYLDDIALSEVNVIMDEDHLPSIEQGDFKKYRENTEDDDEDTVIRMILGAQ